MKGHEVKILKVETDELVPAIILNGKKITLPSIQNGWRFNFDKLCRELSNATAFILTTINTPELIDTPDSIEGCLIFQMIDKKVPYLAYIEIAPHNRQKPKTYDYVAGCLIAFAFRLSLKLGKGDYKGQLFLDVLEEEKEVSDKLIDVYRKKYGALYLGDTRLVIIDEAGHKLIEKFLNVNSVKTN